MGSGCSKGAGAAADSGGDGAIADGGPIDGAERGGRWRRSRTQGLACTCFFSSNASDKHDKEIKQERRERNTSKCMKFMLPCQGRIISSPSSDDDDDGYESESSSDSDRSSNVPTQAATITQISEESLIRSASRFSFIPGRVIGSSSDPSTDGFHNHGECNNLHQFENLERRPSRRNGFQDPFEGSVRFSRTLSVGRLRDRVLRRSSFSDGPHDTSNLAGRRTLNSNNSDDDHQSILLERRRRLRSQVWALQRLGNRVERSSNAVDEANPRSSISRIVMLAEALFEVLDEIHQQAVVLASRPSISSIGSFPAPKEVVEEMPLRVYHKEEALQCYICLLEYEEGDRVRVLPCGHEFHQSCVDKWLKEIHRVCPLCRGDVCISEVAQPEKPDRSL